VKAEFNCANEAARVWLGDQFRVEDASMRAVIGVVLVAVIATPATAADPSDAAGAALKAKAIACFEAHAVEVNRYAASLTDAVGFLQQYLCAQEVSNYERYSANSRILKSWQSHDPLKLMGGGSAIEMHTAAATPEAAHDNSVNEAANLQRVSVDPQTGDLKIPADAPLPEMFEIMTRTGVEDFQAPASIRAEAAEAVLKARQRAATH
jgi:hypothetical protein